MNTKKPKNDERFYFGVAGLVIFALMAAGIIFINVPDRILPTYTTLLGWVGGWVTCVYQFHYGTSAGSVKKSDVINDMTKNNTGNTKAEAEVQVPITNTEPTFGIPNDDDEKVVTAKVTTGGKNDVDSES